MMVSHSNSSRSSYSGRRFWRSPASGIELEQALLQALARLGDQEVVERHAFRRREIGQVVLAQGQLEIAALGDFQRVFQRFGQVGKQFGHLVRGLEILLFGKGLRPPRIAQHIALGNADARLVRLKVVAVHELDRMRGHQRQAEFAGQVGGLLDQHFLLRLAVALHFEIEGAGEDRFPHPGAFTGQLEITVDQRLADIALMRGGECNQARAADFREALAADLRAVAPAFDQIGATQQLAQLLVALPVARQQQQAIGVFRRLRVGDPDIGPGDRLDALAARTAIELDEAEQVAEIGQRQRRHAVAGGALDGVAEADDAVGHGKFGMQAEVDVARGIHGRNFTAPTGDIRNRLRLD